ncbi:MAG: DUF1684 domain-containing protein [Nocardioides sp.]
MTEPARPSEPAAWQEFRRKRVAELTEPHGWLTLRGFYWLPTEGVLPGLPGRWGANAEGAWLEASALDGLYVDGAPLDGRSERTVAETGRVPWATLDDLEIELLNRGGRFAVRLRAETTPEREALTEVPIFDYDESWVIEGRYTAFAEPQHVEVGTIRPDLRQRIWAFGEVEFTAGDETQKLVATSIRSGLGVEFYDPTNGVETEAWRQLKFDDPDPEGRVRLDFNYALNMWFAFTPYATCPAPLPDNRVSVAVRAGERRPTL